MTFILGIDPGLSGACSVHTADGDFVEVMDIPVMESGGKQAFVKNVINAAGFREQLEKVRACRPELLAFVETVGAMPKQGVSSMFSLGHTVGTIQAVLTCAEIPYIMVRPQEWQPFFFGRMSKAVKGAKREKGQSRAYAIRRFPVTTPYLGLAKHHNRAEAILIGYYGCQRMKPAHHTEGSLSA